MKPIDAVSTDATRPLTTVRSKLLQQTGEAFAKKDVFPPNPPTPAQMTVARADRGAPVEGAVPPPAAASKSRRSVDTRA